MGLAYPRSDAVVPLMTTPETRGGRRIAQRKRCLRCHERGVANANKLCEAAAPVTAHDRSHSAMVPR